MKIAAIYTSTTPELIAGVNAEIDRQIGADKVTVMNYQNPAILQEARDNGGVTPRCARMLMDLYEQGVRDGANMLFNICSSVGMAAKLAKPLYELMGIRFVRIDEAMAMAATKSAARIGVIATLPTTLEPTKQLLADCAQRQGRDVRLVDALADGAFGLNQEQFKVRLIETGRKVAGQVDALVFAQGSMAYAEQPVSEALGLPVYSSIRYGVGEMAAIVKGG